MMTYGVLIKYMMNLEKQTTRINWNGSLLLVKTLLHKVTWSFSRNMYYFFLYLAFSRARTCATEILWSVLIWLLFYALVNKAISLFISLLSFFWRKSFNINNHNRTFFTPLRHCNSFMDYSSTRALSVEKPLNVLAWSWGDDWKKL